MNEGQDTWIEIGRLGRPHGLQGELKLQLFNPQSRALDGGVRVSLSAGDDSHAEWTVNGVRGDGEQRIIGFDGVSDRNGAERLVGALVSMRASQLESPDAGEVYNYQLEGFAVLDEKKQDCGIVKKIAAGKAHDLLLIDGGKRGEGMVPFVDEHVMSVDIEKKTICIKDDPSWWS